VLSALFVAAGCGGSGGDFKARYRGIYSEQRQLGLDLVSELRRAGSETDAQLAAHPQAFQPRLARLSSSLAGLGAPRSLRSDLDRLRNALHSEASDLSALIGGVQTHDALRARSATVILLDEAAGAKSAADRLRAAAGLPASP